MPTAVHNFGVNNNWYTDTRAIDHITSNLDKLVVHDKYNGTNQIRTASGVGMNINRIGHALLVLLIVIYISIMFFMYLVPRQILYLCIVLVLITMLYLNFTQTFS
jgi:hypothetical protein